MRIGVPKEIKNRERRVSLPPSSVAAIAALGHEVLVESGAGIGSGFSDADYAAAGAKAGETAGDVWSASELVVKVKEPTEAEYQHLRPDLCLFTYLHLAASRGLTEALIASGCTAIAYETIAAPDGSLPLLVPMSRIAGRMAAQVAAAELVSPIGPGILMGGVPGVAPARVTVIGAGVAGTSAAAVAAALGAHVRLLDIAPQAIERAAVILGDRVETLVSNPDLLDASVRESDAVVGAVLVPGRRAPTLLTAENWKAMRPGSVFVDISIDQGGCAETSRATTHSEPTYIEDGIVHYCVTNMPGAAPRTSTMALSNVTLPYILDLAQSGAQMFGGSDAGVRAGINVADGRLMNEAVAQAHGMEWSV